MQMRTVIIILCSLLIRSAFSQTDSTKYLRDILTLKGYIKDMQISSFGNDLSYIINDNLIHNRLNFRIYPFKNTQAALEIRNRIFTGESVNLNPMYGEQMDVDNGVADMSWLLINEPSLVLLSQVDRAWLNWHNDKWEITAGRQRINWGTNLFWNCNDLFNAYSLVDFDYEELPGADALRIQRYFKNNGGMDLAVKASPDSNEWVGAIKWNFNKWQYDFQLLGGWWYEDVALGAGWAGNMGNAGLKGEATWFQPRTNWKDTTGTLSASISSDYVFSNQMFLTVGCLYNSNGLDKDSLQNGQNLLLRPLTAKNLMPTKFSSIVNITCPVTPLLNASMMALYSPGVNVVFVMPSVGYSLSDNWELSIFGQSFWMEADNFKNVNNGAFIRIKGSF